MKIYNITDEQVKSAWLNEVVDVEYIEIDCQPPKHAERFCLPCNPPCIYELVKDATQDEPIRILSEYRYIDVVAILIGKGLKRGIIWRTDSFDNIRKDKREFRIFTGNPFKIEPFFI